MAVHVLHFGRNLGWADDQIDLQMPPPCGLVCHSLLLLPAIFPSIRVFSSESALCIRWPKYWSFSFVTTPSNELFSPACWELGFQAWAQSTCPELSAQGLVPLRCQSEIKPKSLHWKGKP